MIAEFKLSQLTVLPLSTAQQWSLWSYFSLIYALTGTLYFLAVKQ
jgi:hypothetical protein